MKAHETKTFSKYPALLVGRSVYFEESPAVRKAINSRDILSLTPNKLYKIQPSTSSHFCPTADGYIILYLLDDKGYSIGVLFNLKKEKATSAHLEELTSFKLHSSSK